MFHLSIRLASLSQPLKVGQISLVQQMYKSTHFGFKDVSEDEKAQKGKHRRCLASALARYVC